MKNYSTLIKLKHSLNVTPISKALTRGHKTLAGAPRSRAPPLLRPLRRTAAVAVPRGLPRCLALLDESCTPRPNQQATARRLHVHGSGRGEVFLLLIVSAGVLGIELRFQCR